MNGVFIKDSGPLSVRLADKFHIPLDDIYPLLMDTLKKVRSPKADSRKLWQPVLDKLHLSYEEFFEFWFHGESLNEELLSFTKELKEKGIKIIILSNNFPERTNHYRQLYPELFQVLDEEYFSWETGNIKPDPKAYSQILDSHPFHPSEYLYFDDKDDYLAAAGQLGIITHKFSDIEDTKSFISNYVS